MTGPGPVGPGPRPLNGAPPRDDLAQLRKVATQLEGVFMAQLFQAMRQSVPDSGLMENSPGEKLFTSMLDDQLAQVSASRMQRGLADALFRQLSRRLQQTQAPSAPEALPPAPHGEGA